MASYFDELHVDENEMPVVSIERMTRETFRMLFDQDPIRYSEIVNFLNTPPASKSEIKKLKAPSLDELLGNSFFHKNLIFFFFTINVLGEQCRICLCQYQVNDTALNMPCNHIFHENCLKKWLEKVIKYSL